MVVLSEGDQLYFFVCIIDEKVFYISLGVGILLEFGWVFQDGLFSECYGEFFCCKVDQLFWLKVWLCCFGIEI